MAPGDSEHVNDDAQISRETREINQLELVVTLYQQGRSATEIRDLMDIPLQTVNGLVRAAGVMRTPQEAGQLSNRRWVARSKIARLDIAALAVRWIDGDEPEELADEFGVLADLLWDALAVQLSKKDPTKPAPRFACSGTCSYGCTKQCAMRQQVSDRANLPGSSSSKAAAGSLAVGTRQ